MGQRRGMSRTERGCASAGRRAGCWNGVVVQVRAGVRRGLDRVVRVRVADREVREAAGKAPKPEIQEQRLWPQIRQEVEVTYLVAIGWPTAAPVLVPIADGVGSGAALRG